MRNALSIWFTLSLTFSIQAFGADPASDLVRAGYKINVFAGSHPFKTGLEAKLTVPQHLVSSKSLRPSARSRLETFVHADTLLTCLRKLLANYQEILLTETKLEHEMPHFEKSSLQWLNEWSEKFSIREGEKFYPDLVIQKDGSLIEVQLSEEHAPDAEGAKILKPIIIGTGKADSVVDALRLAVNEAIKFKAIEVETKAVEMALHTLSEVERGFFGPASIPCPDTKLPEPSATKSIGKAFVEAEVERRFGVRKRHVDLEEGLTLDVYDKASYLVWNQGPRKGRIFEMIEKGDGKTFTPPSINEFYDRLHQYYDGLAKIANSEDLSLRKPLIEWFVNIFEKEKHGDFTFREARYFAFDKSANEWLELYEEIQKKGVYHWLSVDSKTYLKGIRVFPAAQTKKRANADILPFLDSIYVASASASESSGAKAKKPLLYLTHGTFSNKLPNIIQLGALASHISAERAGIPKRSGGEYGANASDTPFKVSFWGDEKGNAKVILGYGPQTGFEFPITFGANKEHSLDPLCRGGRFGGAPRPLPRGSTEGEVVALDYFKLSCIDYVFVPPFAVSEVQTSLRDHGFSSIEVISYSTANTTQLKFSVYEQKTSVTPP